MNTKPGILGRKVGMTQFFDESGTMIPCTVIEAGPATVLQVKTDESDGYKALQLGFGARKDKHTTKAMKGHFAKSGAAPQRLIREIRLDNTGSYTPGQQINIADLFKVGDRVDVTGRSKGRGFAGVMKRHNFKGFIRSHGTHEYFRHSGSIGTRLTPGMVQKGMRMGGHMGDAKVTVQNLTIARIDAERNLIFVKGGIPGANGQYVTVRNTVKKFKAK